MTRLGEWKRVAQCKSKKCGAIREYPFFEVCPECGIIQEPHNLIARWVSTDKFWHLTLGKGYWERKDNVYL